MGEHQALNCGLALALLDQLKLQGVRIDDRAAIKGLQGVYLPGRMEMAGEIIRSFGVIGLQRTMNEYNNK